METNGWRVSTWKQTVGAFPRGNNLEVFMFGSFMSTLGSGLSRGLGYAGKFMSSGLGSGLLASGLDAGVSSAFGLIGANRGYKQSKRLARYQAKLNYKYAQKYALNSPSWTVHGYRAAGINPILAAMHGNLSVSDNPTSVNTIQSSSPDLSAAASSRPFSHSFEVLQRRRENEIAAETVKQTKIKTDSMLSDLESQRSSDFINTLLNSAKAAVLLRVAPGVVRVSKSGYLGEEEKPTPSVYGLFDHYGWRRQNYDKRTDPGMAKQVKAFQDVLDLAAEKYIRDTLSLASGSARDAGSTVSDFGNSFRKFFPVKNKLPKFFFRRWW